MTDGATDMEDRTGRVIGNWRIERLLGQGAFGAVYEAGVRDRCHSDVGARMVDSPTSGAGRAADCRPRASRPGRGPRAHPDRGHVGAVNEASDPGPTSRLRFVLTLVQAATLAGGCNWSFSSTTAAPFPCGGDGLCPRGTICNSRNQCEKCTYCNGQCKTLDADPNNCGSCGHVCPSNGVAEVECTGGVCVIIHCAPNRIECNGDPEDGCEIDVSRDSFATNPRACGQCGVDCGSGQCCNGTCVDLQQDVNNCGACATACRACDAGKCLTYGCRDLMACAANCSDYDCVDGCRARATDMADGLFLSFSSCMQSTCSPSDPLCSVEVACDQCRTHEEACRADDAEIKTLTAWPCP